jgi:hypothetical protein
MRETYEFTAFIRALDAWEAHRADWLKKMRDAKQPAPTKEQIDGYRNIWLEGYLDCYAENQAKSGESTGE